MKNIFKFCCLIFACMGSMHMQAQVTQVIAHRGFWKTDLSAQNSIASLEKAAQLKVYGSEFDVHLTKDNVLVINHDNDIEGVFIETANFSQFSHFRLANGEKLPTLENYLQQGKKYPELQLILEIKAHSTPERETEVVKQIVQLVKKMAMEKQVEYISFSAHMCSELKKAQPHSSVVYLNGDLSPAEVKKKGWDGIDYHYKIFQKNPQWIKESHQLGLSTNAWTVNKDEDMQQMIDLGIQFISTDQPLELNYLLTNK